MTEEVNSLEGGSDSDCNSDDAVWLAGLRGVPDNKSLTGFPLRNSSSEIFCPSSSHSEQTPCSRLSVKL